MLWLTYAVVSGRWLSMNVSPADAARLLCDVVAE
jgi:hypothetical protein